MEMEQAKSMLNEYIKSEAIKMHSREVAAIMKELAKELKEDENKWEITGLLHDLDYEIAPDPMQHAKKTEEILKSSIGEVDQEIMHAILSHNEENTNVKRESRLDYALSAADNISGIIYAYALMRKTFEGMDISGLKKKLKDKSFAASVKRESIYDVEKIGIQLDVFLSIAVKAMTGIKGEIGF